MQVITLRGEDWECGRDFLRTKLRRPIKSKKGNFSFSISDQAKAYLSKAVRIEIVMEGKVYTITKDMQPFQTEVVPSKFPGANPWHRYWYYVNEESGKEFVGQQSQEEYAVPHNPRGNEDGLD